MRKLTSSPLISISFSVNLRVFLNSDKFPSHDQSIRMSSCGFICLQLILKYRSWYPRMGKTQSQANLVDQPFHLCHTFCTGNLIHLLPSCSYLDGWVSHVIYSIWVFPFWSELKFVKFVKTIDTTSMTFVLLSSSDRYT